MIFPPKLKPGDTIGIVAPARKIFPEQLESAIQILQSWGLKILPAKNIFSSIHPYLAGSDVERRQDFQNMIDDPTVNAILCARGGYGCTRIIDDINFSPLKNSPKWIIGFSDVTAIHLRLIRMGFASIHGTMPILFNLDAAQSAVESLKKILFNGSGDISISPEKTNRSGNGAGEVLGGNLSLVVDSLATPSEPDTNNRILFLEEIDEYLYKVDRMFTQLSRAGKLENLAGLLIGHMTDLKNSELAFGESVSQIVLHAVRDYNYPVAFSFPSGHQNPNIAWIHGATATLNVSETQVDFSYPNIYSISE